jgi:hypothetical protein
MEKLHLFFAAVKELSLWQRIFSWKRVRSLSYDAFAEFQALRATSVEMNAAYSDLEKKFAHTSTVNETLQNNVQQYERMIFKKDEESQAKNSRIDNLNSIIAKLTLDISKMDSVEEQRMVTFESRIGQLNQLKETLENERTRLQDERIAEQKASFEKMKGQWAEHEMSVAQSIKMICRKHSIKYIDTVPFRGNPDNAIEICDEFIIFDAKSPYNDDLSNFPRYIKTQTESVKKYAGQEKVKKDIFLVVPANTIHVISQLTCPMGDYNVFIITKDSLEPIIVSLQKIEEYEFAEQLSPEERDNICRVIGKFAHTTKRKIQVDQFFAAEFLELLSRCKNDLPGDILEQVIEFEKAERTNPPAEKKSKQILTSELLENHLSINAEAGIRDVIIPLNFDEVKNLE